jgi:N-acetylneuraminate synthase/N,N'-diacetyllegionaminate synthase
MNNFLFNHEFSISGRGVGLNHPVFIIAEAGVAHFGSIDKAKRLVDLAVEAKADAVKFQIFKTDALISKESEEWRNRMRARELPFEAFQEIQAYCHEKRIIFFATAHDEPSLEFLDTLNVPVYKIGSGEVSNWSFLEKIASKKKPVILSTGMYTLEDICEALKFIAKTGNPDIALLHCVTSYPTPPLEVNLLAMDTIREAYGVIVGYSDHTRGFHFSLAAAARGASIIEKHITLDFNIPDAQDWKVSCGPDDFPVMVQQIRDIEAGLGSGIKAPAESERPSINWARKSLVAIEDILEGEIIDLKKIGAKRPGYGIMPSDIDRVIGKKANKKIKKDTLIKWEHLK